MTTSVLLDPPRHGLLAQKRSILLLGTTVLMLLVVTLAFSGYVQSAGYQIPSENLQLDYLIGAMWALLLGVVIAALPLDPFDKENLLLGWLAKSYITLVFMLPYEKHYELDCFGYFWGMRQPWFFFWDWSPQARGRVFVIYVGWLQERIFDSYHALKVSFAMIGFISIYLVYRAAMAVIGRKHSDAFLYFALFPSVLFWSSIIGKDPLVFIGVALYVYGVAKWRATGHIRYVLAFAVGTGFATFVRPWMGTILSIPLMYFVARSARGYLSRVAFTAASVLVLSIVIQQFAARWDVENTEDLVSTTDSIAHQFSRSATGASGSTRSSTTQFTSIPIIIAFFPIGLFTVLFRPLPGEVNNVFGVISGVENLILLFWTIQSLREVIRNRIVRKCLRREPTVIWAVLLVITWSALYGFISFSNLGASVRFRLPIIAVFLSLLLAVKWVRQEVRSLSVSATPAVRLQPAHVATTA